MADFEADWAAALRTDSADIGRWLVFPDPDAPSQVALAEWVKAQQVLEALRDRHVRSGRVLEYGCGAAGMAIFLKNRGFSCCALDRSVDALRVAALNDARHATTPVPLLRTVGDASALPVPDGAFDVVMSYGLLEHFDAPAASAVLRESARTLRPGGVFVADIIPARPNARMVATYVNYATSVLYHAVRGRWAAIPSLWQRYFDHYFETSFDAATWARLIEAQGFAGVAVQVCRPFPPLSLPASLERRYVRLMRRALPFWRWFDRSQAPFTRLWGWMYLAVAVKPLNTSLGSPAGGV